MSIKQTLSLHIGQAGVQLGNAIWELISLEHGIKINGDIAYQHRRFGVDKSVQSFFYMLGNKGKKFAPRCIYIDSESMVIDEVRCGSYKNFFLDYTLVCGDEDAANLYPRGYYVSRKCLLKPTFNAIRKIFENSDNMHGLMLFRSCVGGTGSGGASLLLAEIEKEYIKSNVSDMALIPSPCISTTIVEPYNAVLALSQTMNHTNLSMLLDNQALYDIFYTNLNIRNPGYVAINQILGHVVSSLTASLRFESSLSYDFNIYQTNLIPFPELKYPIVSYVPITALSKEFENSKSVLMLTKEACQGKNFLIKCFPEYGEHIASAILYRGKKCRMSDVMQALYHIKSNNTMKFVEWCPTGFKIGITRQPPLYIDNSYISKARNSVCLLTNSTCISQVLDYIIQKFDILFKTKAYIHWYTGEGLEEAELKEARGNLMKLLNSYIDCIQK